MLVTNCFPHSASDRY